MLNKVTVLESLSTCLCNNVRVILCNRAFVKGWQICCRMPWTVTYSLENWLPKLSLVQRRGEEEGKGRAYTNTKIISHHIISYHWKEKILLLGIWGKFLLRIAAMKRQQCFFDCFRTSSITEIGLAGFGRLSAIKLSAASTCRALSNASDCDGASRPSVSSRTSVSFNSKHNSVCLLF